MAEVETTPLRSPDVFLHVLGEYSQHFPYVSSSIARETLSAEHYLVPHAASLVRFLPLKPSWFLSEIVAFDGEEFVYAATRSLRQRAPTATELQLFAVPAKFSAKLEFLIQLDHMNRRERSGVRLLNVSGARTLWRVHRWFDKRRMRRMAKLAHGIFRAKARHDLKACMQDALIRQLLYTCLDRLDRLQVRSNDT